MDLVAVIDSQYAWFHCVFFPKDGLEEGLWCENGKTMRVNEADSYQSGCCLALVPFIAN